MFRKAQKRNIDICPRISCPLTDKFTLFPDRYCGYSHLKFIPPEVLIKETENLFILILDFLGLFFSKPLQKMIFSYTDFSEVVMISNFFKIFPYNSVFYLGGEIKRKLQFIINHFPNLNDFDIHIFYKWKKGTCICKSCRCEINVYFNEYFGFTRESEYCGDCSTICSVEETKICRKYTCSLCKRNKCECEMNEEIPTKKFKHCKKCVELWNKYR